MYQYQEGAATVQSSISSGMNNMSQKAAENKKEEDKKADKIDIESRFGAITVSLENAIYFPQGLLGLPENLHFVLTDIPVKNMGQFKLLQCLNDHSLSFVVLPLGVENKFIESKDIEDCCNIMGVKKESALVLLIVSVQRSPESVKITANVRAPVMVDSERKVAGQYVFPNNKYEICQPLSSK